ncbi:MAG TPA: hypothetical protein VKG24_06610 [Pseudolabrys sp.]|nr:hypothetical protein [Pseudolabrys sp.]
MQAMQVLASSGVTMAAGAMISLSFAVSPPLTLLPPRPLLPDANGNVALQKNRVIETAGKATANGFESRWQAATDDIPPLSLPRRDPLEGLIGGLPTSSLAQDVPPVVRDARQNLAAEPPPEQQETLTVPQPSARPSDVCALHGLYRVDYMQNHHRYWRCASRRLIFAHAFRAPTRGQK